MSENNSENASMVLAHVLFMDIVGYSKLPIDGQTEISNKLKEIVLNTRDVKTATAKDELISLFTGDGMALVFLSNPLAPIQCAMEISRELKMRPEIELRMGVHSGIVEKISDVNDKVNVAGGGINMAQRVMDCGDNGHILLSKRVAEDLSQYSKWQPFLHDLGETEVKHGVMLEIYNFYSDEVGNLELPAKFQTSKRGSSTLAKVTAVVVAFLIIGAIASVYYFSNANQSEIVVTTKTEDEFTKILEKKQADWMKIAFLSQAKSGGIKDSPVAPESTAQVWTTAQCLTGILTADKPIEKYQPQIKNAFKFIDDKRIDELATGWNLYGDSNEYTITEINSWVTVSYIKSLEKDKNLWDETETQEIVTRIKRELDEIKTRQDTNGGWRPIKDENTAFTRTYSTVLALWSLFEARNSKVVSSEIGTEYDSVIDRGINWLLQNYQSERGWVQNPNREQSDKFEGLTAHTLFVLSLSENIDAFLYIKEKQIYKSAKKGFINNKQIADWKIDANNSSVPSPDLRFNNTSFVPQGTSFLWFPWSLATLSKLSIDETLSLEERESAKQMRLEILNNNADKLEKYVEDAKLNFLLGENLFGVSIYLNTLENN